MVGLVDCLIGLSVNLPLQLPLRFLHLYFYISTVSANQPRTQPKSGSPARARSKYSWPFLTCLCMRSYWLAQRLRLLTSSEPPSRRPAQAAADADRVSSRAAWAAIQCLPDNRILFHGLDVGRLILSGKAGHGPPSAANPWSRLLAGVRFHGWLFAGY